MKKFDIKGAWEEVARSNLSKIDSNTGMVLRRDDGKILKPANWTPPNLTRFV
jgi:predicted HAD superfamily Cof-like phosphohydrolase